jgi:hypothetical protein
LIGYKRKGAIMVWLAITSTVIFSSVVAGLWFVRTREASMIERLEANSQFDYDQVAQYAEFCPQAINIKAGQ